MMTNDNTTTDLDELDINPFYQALQTSYSKQFENAQDNCCLICVPITTSLNGIGINSKLINTHILKPSPYFKGQYYTCCSKEKVFQLDENLNEIFSDAYLDSSRTKILNEEIGYNKEYKPYRILIIEKPLDPNVKVSRKNHKKNFSDFVLTKQSSKECHKWLASFPEFKPAISELDDSLKNFHRNYLVLPDYLENTSKYLMELSEESVKRCCAAIVRPLNTDVRFVTTLRSVIESYITESVYSKIFPVISRQFFKPDQLILSKCSQLKSIDNRQLGIDHKFDCDLTDAVLCLKELDLLCTPLEKLMCIKDTLDKISETINKDLEQKTPFGRKSHQSIFITSDDLIPLLAKVIIKSESSHLESNVYYMDIFNWSSVSKDMDNLSYCLVTLKAAILYMTNLNITIDDRTETAEDLLNVNATELPMTTTKKCQLPSKVTIKPSSSLDERMDRITQRLKEFQNESKDENPKVKSIFKDSYRKKMPSQMKKELTSKSSRDASNPDLGEFLSRAQDNIFGETCGKLT